MEGKHRPHIALGADRETSHHLGKGRDMMPKVPSHIRGKEGTMEMSLWQILALPGVYVP